eukprot:Cvel_26775.t1-p1 / transcript=Cvel_26775.t1 / gene=Cvel_26775 / organism=Chromera_velia_CCMP2878 / gene_product=hypothetical protein / transcript_product=hypothetical protein / location=Cvel_scaffold3238:9054-18363(+) / protein_length=904 / sequence_SO=supercontig / SO=protein_coding / is_pseudo=false
MRRLAQKDADLLALYAFRLITDSECEVDATDVLKGVEETLPSDEGDLSKRVMIANAEAFSVLLDKFAPVRIILGQEIERRKGVKTTPKELKEELERDERELTLSNVGDLVDMGAYVNLVEEKREKGGPGATPIRSEWEICPAHLESLHKAATDLSLTSQEERAVAVRHVVRYLRALDLKHRPLEGSAPLWTMAGYEDLFAEEEEEEEKRKMRELEEVKDPVKKAEMEEALKKEKDEAQKIKDRILFATDIPAEDLNRVAALADLLRVDKFSIDKAIDEATRKSFEKDAINFLNKMGNETMTLEETVEAFRDSKQKRHTLDKSFEETVSLVMMRKGAELYQSVQKMLRARNVPATVDLCYAILRMKKMMPSLKDMLTEKEPGIPFDEMDRRSFTGQAEKESAKKIMQILYDDALSRGGMTDERTADLELFSKAINLPKVRFEDFIQRASVGEASKVIQKQTDDERLRPTVPEWTPSIADDFAKKRKEEILPILRKRVRATENAFDRGMMNDYEDVVRRMTELGMGADKKAKERGYIPSENERQELFRVRAFRGVSQRDVRWIHAQYFGKAYQSAVREGLGTTGVMTPFVEDEVESLREWLLLSVESATSLEKEAYKQFASTVLLKEVAYQLKTKERTEEQEEMDERKGGGDDPFIKNPKSGLGFARDTKVRTSEKNFLDEGMNLVRFFEENGLLSESTKQDTEQDAEKNNENEEKGPKRKKTYEVQFDLRGSRDDEELDEIYSEFLMTVFTSEEGPRRQELLDAASKLNAILGQAPEKAPEPEPIVETEIPGDYEEDEDEDEEEMEGEGDVTSEPEGETEQGEEREIEELSVADFFTQELPKEETKSRSEIEQADIELMQQRFEVDSPQVKKTRELGMKLALRYVDEMLRGKTELDKEDWVTLRQ